MALVSEKAFERITFISANPVDKTIYYPKFTARDTEARETYRNEIRRSRSYRDDLSSVVSGRSGIELAIDVLYYAYREQRSKERNNNEY